MYTNREIEVERERESEKNKCCARGMWMGLLYKQIDTLFLCC